MMQLLYGWFNTVLNWVCGIFCTISVPALFVAGHEEDAWKVLFATLGVLGLKALLEVIKILKEVWPVVAMCRGFLKDYIIRKKIKKENGTDIKED